MMSWLLQDAAVATVIAIVLLVVLGMRRVSPGLEHVLWLLVSVKFVFPPLVGLSVPVGGAIVEAVSSSAATVVIPVVDAERGATGREVAEPARIRVGPAPGPAPERIDRVAVRPDWRWLLAVWPIGALVVLVLRVGDWVRWRRSRRLLPAPAELSSIVEETAGRLRVRTPAVYVEPGIGTPMVMGLARPRLLWPARLVGSMTRDRTVTIAAHELAHIRRGDLWVALLELVGGCVWWWYPGWRFVRRRLRDASERACDALVIAAYPAYRRAYADALLDIAGGEARRPVIALGLGTRTSVRRRLQNILGDSASRSRLAPVAIVLVAGLLLPAWRIPTGQEDVVAVLAGAVADSDPDVRRSVANALRDVGGSAADAVLRELVDDPDADVRHAARSALGLEPPRPNLRFPEDGPPTAGSAELDSLAALLTRGDATDRIAAARRFGNLRDARAVAVLLVARNDTDFRVRQAAADALGNIGDASAATAVAMLLDDAHPRVRQSAAGALGSIGSGAQVSHLAEALRDEDAHVRRVAAEALGRIGTRMRQ